MKKLNDTFMSNLYQYLTEILPLPLIVAILCAVIFILLKIKKDKKCSIKDTACIFFFIFFLMNILQITIINRRGMYFDNIFDNLLTGWIITSNKYKYDFSALFNIILFTPFTFFLSCIKKEKPTKKLLLSCTIISFSMSVTIESLQAIFHLGTFQLSDLTYNTLGGFIGALIYYVINKAIKRKNSSE